MPSSTGRSHVIISSHVIRVVTRPAAFVVTQHSRWGTRAAWLCGQCLRVRAQHAAVVSFKGFPAASTDALRAPFIPAQTFAAPSGRALFDKIATPTVTLAQRAGFTISR
jgi:hypothetical protein